MTLRLLPAWTAAAVGAAVVLAGCTPLASDAEPSADASSLTDPTVSAVATAPAGTPDPCDVMTLKTLNKIVGLKMADGEFNSSLSYEGRNICEWRPHNEERSEPRVQVEINWEYPDPVRHRELAEAVFGNTFTVKKTIKGAEDAYALPSRRTIGMGVGDYFVKVSYIQPGRKEGKNMTLEIAREVAASLNPEAAEG
ncbi:DUF3558 domain-containing protein [Demequina maris]|uniref:DUF3558 domain-containing protein n=1 Tax=Demequina maris TaxID=1638982 RepID=UPI0007827EDE|nr:DUF3558 domain-containing protein [Demequina maris]